MLFSAASPIFKRFCCEYFCKTLRPAITLKIALFRKVKLLNNKRNSVRNVMTSSNSQPTRSILQSGVGMHQNILGSVILDNLWSFNSVRSIIRCHFPYPRETKRIRCHGFKKRMSTKGGRAILMRRILKGRHVLSH